MSKHLASLTLAGLMALAAVPVARAAVPAAEAARLKAELTPLGAERAANKDGSIPAWTGGLTTPTPGFVNGGRRPDPFAAEKPLYSITAKNLAQHEGRLTDGVKALFKRYPDSYRIDVYKTHRTAAAPQWVYDNTAKNALSGKLEGGKPSQVVGGIPFPIPTSGEQVLWNHLLRWRGTDVRLAINGIQTTAEGRSVLTVDGVVDQTFPYYIDTLPAAARNEYWLIRLLNIGPPIRAGEAIVGRNNIDEDKTQSWVYLTGQRRVRKLPVTCCDTPTPATAGLMSFDEVGVWTGRTDRFDWKLVGKQEMLIPYNSNRSLLPPKAADLVTPKHLNPDHVRWELHRVWVVEATLKAGQRHQVARARYYVDEDSWMAVLGDRWDGNGQLWKTMWALPFAMPDLPGVYMGANGFYDLLTGSYFANDVTNEKKAQFELMPRYKDAVFTPEAMAGEGLR